MVLSVRKILEKLTKKQLIRFGKTYNIEIKKSDTKTDMINCIIRKVNNSTINKKRITDFIIILQDRDPRGLGGY